MQQYLNYFLFVLRHSRRRRQLRAQFRAQSTPGQPLEEFTKGLGAEDFGAVEGVAVGGALFGCRSQRDGGLVAGLFSQNAHVGGMAAVGIGDAGDGDAEFFFQGVLGTGQLIQGVCGSLRGEINMGAGMRTNFHARVAEGLDLFPGDEAPANGIGAGDVEGGPHVVFLQHGEDVGVLFNPAIVHGDGDGAGGERVCAADCGSDFADGDGVVAQALEQGQLGVKVVAGDVVAGGAVAPTF